MTKPTELSPDVSVVQSCAALAFEQQAHYGELRGKSFVPDFQTIHSRFC